MKTHAMTPAEIVTQLDKYIIGQRDAKKAVAIAIRNRWRRQQLPKALREDVMPKNIIMMGPTGIGKTEIARRLSILLDAPFVKVEASNYTEIGYVGRDVESMIRDLLSRAISMVEHEQVHKIEKKAEISAQDKLLDILVTHDHEYNLPVEPNENMNFRKERIKAKLRQQLNKGELNDLDVEIQVKPSSNAPVMEMLSNSGMENMGFDFQQLIRKIVPGQNQPAKTKKMKVTDAMIFLGDEESQKLIDKDKVIDEARDRVENSGIVFIDEFDKIAHRETEYSGIAVSREGVQRDLLPMIEGSVVNTRYGPVRTHHILFIAAGAFHTSAPSDLIPEMQGRFPIRVRLHPLTRNDFVRILTEPQNALIKQYQALLATENVTLKFTEDAIDEIAKTAEQINLKHLDIGARRLHTILERLLDDISFQAPDIGKTEFTLDRELVFLKLAGVIDDEDLSRYAL